jgi:hypothetical protein
MWHQKRVDDAMSDGEANTHTEGAPCLRVCVCVRVCVRAHPRECRRRDFCPNFESFFCLGLFTTPPVATLRAR